MRVFLGGTTNDSEWREVLKPRLQCEYFDPVVSDWNEAAQQREIHEREICDIVLYTITPKMLGVYAIAEAVDDSNKRPEKTMMCLLYTDDSARFDPKQWRSLLAVARMVEHNGAQVFFRLADVADAINHTNRDTPH